MRLLNDLKELRQAALYCLSLKPATEKAETVAALANAWGSGELQLEPQVDLQAAMYGAIPGRPDKPELVPPLSVKRRAMNTIAGRAILIHALAHIEFNAINLALDAIWRFPSMPAQYYADWLKVAQEEALHFTLLNQHLQSQGYAYGDFPGHNSLWEMVQKTEDDVLARMALVPRTMEARGLDASPPLRAKLAQAGDMVAASILDIILRDEIGHVAIGNYWYNWLCQHRGLEPVSTYASLTIQYQAPKLRGPFNFEARRAAGFTEPELAALV